MAEYLIQDTSLKNIADAIREKTKKVSLLTPDAMVDEIKTLSREETLPHADIPDFVKEGVLDVVNKVRAVQTDDSITFLAMADSHHCGEQSDTDWKDYINLGNLHAAMAAKIISYLLKMDFVCYLGDITFGSSTTTSELLHQQISEFNSWIDEAYKGIPQFRTVGNHDTGMYAYQAGNAELETAEYLYDVIGSYCERDSDANFTFSGNKEYGYCSLDFLKKKLCVICLNTSEGDTVGSSSYECSPEQLLWFANRLRSHGSYADWNYIILGHYPLDFSSTYPASSVLKAYVNGESITLNGTTVDFNGYNNAKVIGQFHGHTHCFKYAKLNEINSETNTATEYDAWRIAVPNSCFYRNNHQEGASEHGIYFGEDETYDKSIGSSDDTSFVINVVNPTEEVIYSFCYGAGYDRVIGYGATAYRGIKKFLSNLSISNEVGGVKDGESFSATITPDEYAALSSVSITMDGEDITSSAYKNCNINIPEVTGEVVISARATLNLDCTNQIPISTDINGDIYNDVGYKSGTFINLGNDSISSGISATGFIPIESGDVLRLHNMNFIKGVAHHRLVFYDANKTYIGIAQANSSYFMDGAYSGVAEDGENYTQFTIRTGSSYAPSKGAAYVRICCANITGASVITINEEVQYVDVADGNYSVVNHLINATNSNAAKSVAYNSGYTANIAAEDGYIINNVVVTMDGIDVTSDVYSDGAISILVVTGDIVITVTTTKEEVVLYSVTNNMTHAINSNEAASVEGGSNYVANISAEVGYKLDSVVVTMGGANITSTVYSNGNISISNVTGDIVITAIATVSNSSSSAYTNQIPISTDTDGTIFNGTGYQSGYRLGSSGTLSGQSGSYVTGFIPCKVGDVVRMKNVTFQYGVTTAPTSSNQRLSFYNSSKAHILQTNATGLGGVCGGVKGDDNIWTEFTVKQTMSGTDCSATAYFRINAAYIGADSIITVNEEIVDITITNLYNAGDQCTSVTGGWTNSGWTHGDYPIVASTISDTNMTVTGGYTVTNTDTGVGVSRVSIVGTTNKVSMDNTSKIYADLELTATGTVYLRACSSTDTSVSDASVVVATVGTKTVELDVSSLTGEYYIAILAVGTSGYGYYPSAKITKVWAE